MNRKLKLQELNRDSVEEFKVKEKHPIIVILDNIRSLNNIGSFFRTCDAFNVQELILTGITAQPPHREIQKTALGSTNSVDWRYFEESTEALEYVKSLGYKIYAIEQTEKVILMQDLNTNGEKTAVVFGNEVDGVKDDVINMCDGVVEIPQFGTKHSLNVSVCGGAVIWDLTKQFIQHASN
ncbi:MAG: 23S rRNA (guanosine2251-2'-O)-methyltransferase [Flavobacteriales bacterium]|jgi:23S rRNA (guanosine2251-2'-O)-methyltransferase